MDSVSGGESIRALILLQMELFTNGQCLYLICSYSSLFIALLSFYDTLLHLLHYSPQILSLEQTVLMFGRCRGGLGLKEKS